MFGLPKFTPAGKPVLQRSVKVAEGVSELEEKWESTVEPLAAVKEVQGDFMAFEEEFEDGVGGPAVSLRKVSVMQRGSSVRLLTLICYERGSLLRFRNLSLL